MADFRIQKFKRVGKDVVITVLERQSDGTMGADDKRRRSPLHKDFEQALDNIRVHFALLSGGLKRKDVLNVKSVAPELVEEFHVHGYSFGGGDDKDLGISMSGHRMLEGDHASPGYSTRFALFEEAPDTRYVHMDHLQKCLARLDEEARAYLDGTKRGAGAQTSLDLKAAAKPDTPGKVTKAKIAAPAESTPLTATGAKLPKADKDAQKRVQEWSPKGYQADVDKSPAGGKVKKGKQTPDNPGGE